MKHGGSHVITAADNADRVRQPNDAVGRPANSSATDQTAMACQGNVSLRRLANAEVQLPSDGARQLHIEITEPEEQESTDDHSFEQFRRVRHTRSRLRNVIGLDQLADKIETVASRHLRFSTAKKSIRDQK